MIESAQRQDGEERQALRQGRDRRALKTGAVGVGVQAANHAIRLVVIPLSIAMLGVEQYGLFLVVGSLVAWGGMADLGLAPGLINVVAAADGRGDRAAMQRAVSTAFAAYGVLAAGVAAGVWAVSRWDALPALLGAGAMVEEARALVLVCGWIYAAGILTQVSTTTSRALQQGHWDFYGQFAAAVAGLAALGVVFWRGGGLVAYALACSLPLPVMQALLGVYVFRVRRPWLAPAWAGVNRESLRALAGVAGPLAVSQAANYATLYSTNVLIANRLGAAMVPQFSVPYAAFAILANAASQFSAPYMAAFAEARARRDWTWMRRRARVLALAGGAGMGVAAVGVAAVAPWLIPWWTGGAIRPASSLLWALALLSVVRLLSNTSCSLLAGAGQVRLVGAVMALGAVGHVAGIWTVLPEWGLPAAALAAAAGLTPSALALTALGRARA